MAHERMLKGLAAPNLDHQPLCIQYPTLDVNFELKSSLIHLLPSSHGLPGEDPNKHLTEFHIVCSSMKPALVTEKQIKLRAFPFSFKDGAKEWIYYLPLGTFNIWNEMKTLFLERYFPASKVGSIKKEICGLFPLDKSMIDAASGGALVDKTPAVARSLISNMAANSQQFRVRQEVSVKGLNETNSKVEQQLAQLTSMVQPMALGQQVRPCGICQLVGHPTDARPTLQEDTNENINAMGGFPGKPRQRYDPYAITYNEGWKEHPNLRYGNQQQTIPNRPPGVTQQDKDETPTTSPKPKPTIPTYVTTPPFPIRLRKTKKDEVEQEVLETFCKVEINIPLLDAIEQVPRYAKFLKELCTNKRKLKGNAKVSMGENVSAVLQKKLPPKCKDHGTFTIPCTISNDVIERCILYLGASINVMPYSIYTSLNLGSLEETEVIIQLADRSNAYPRGVVEDVLVKVNELVFPVDFYILDMEDDSLPCSTPILLGRPFLKTARTKIDVHEGTLTREFDGEVIRFNIFEAMKYRSDVPLVSSIDILDSLSQRILDLHGEDGLDVVLREPIDLKEDDVTTELKETVATLNSGGEVFKAVSFLEFPVSHEKLQPSVKSPPKLELKPLPELLKYVYLGERETLLVIITTKLTQVQEDHLIRVL
ncbi:uncharacterized protein LOC133825133 [Humulus lupulus]|uniref:uncharacterized protein LOC133825133 n=1 Tax=Humulus lupulus TaxID=3486 RepID=UPI002B400442|nr:uncharacterized protein LOC133825133 [Humulus lupulus]